MSATLCSTSRMRIHTRALTSPAVSTGTVKVKPIVRRVAGHFARIDIASARASDIAGRAELPRQLGAQDACRGGAVLQRRGIVVKLDQARKPLLDLPH